MIGVHTISKVVSKLMEQVEIEGYFMNHSLRRTGGTRLFRAGVERKLVKEVTGHRSDAVDAYQITGHDQRKQISNILQGSQNSGTNPQVAKVETEKIVSESESKSHVCQCGKDQLNEANVTEFVKELLKQTKDKGKTTIKIEIEINK